MKVLITGICGFVGSALAHAIQDAGVASEIIGIDSFIRPGSELNRPRLQARGIRVLHADLRAASDFEGLPEVDWVIDAAANASVMAGVDGQASSRQLVEHNLVGTINLLEYCKQHRAGFILLSTSRVYSIAPLVDLELEVDEHAFEPVIDDRSPVGLTPEGLSEEFPTNSPVSLYGATKLSSEALALEYGASFDFPVWINRCGVLAGAGQFGRADQGIFSFWVHSFREQAPLRYIGFAGSGHQVRDALHPRDLASLLLAQMRDSGEGKNRVQNVSGGRGNSTSLWALSKWCEGRFGAHPVESDLAERPFDVPWLVLSSALARAQWGWEPTTKLDEILDEIADFAEENPEWLKKTAPF